MRLLELTSWPLEPFVARKLKGLAERGVAVTVASPVSARRARSGIKGVKLVRLPRPGESRIASALWVLRDALVLALRDSGRLARLLRGVRPLKLLRIALPLVLAEPDVVHFEWIPHAARYLPLFDPLERPIAVSCRGPGINILPHTGLRVGHPRSFGSASYAEFASNYPAVFARAAAVHCVSEAIASEAERYGLDPAKAHVIRPSVDTAFFSPGRPIDSAEFRVASIGFLSWVKGHADGLTAVASLAREGVPISYQIIGHEPQPGAAMASDRERLLYLIHELGLTDRVQLTGALSREQVRDRLRASHVLLHPSYSEGIANSVIEAMSCALPVVVTDVGGMGEVLTDGVHGFLCPPREPHAFADALRSIWQDKALARRLGQAGRTRVLADFSASGEIEAFVEFYAQLEEAQMMAGRSRPPRAALPAIGDEWTAARLRTLSPPATDSDAG